MTGTECTNNARVQLGGNGSVVVGVPQEKVNRRVGVAVIVVIIVVVDIVTVVVVGMVLRLGQGMGMPLVYLKARDGRQMRGWHLLKRWWLRLLLLLLLGVMCVVVGVMGMGVMLTRRALPPSI